MNDHVRIEEMIAARALDGLDPRDAEELDGIISGHGVTCVECQRMLADYDEVAGRLAFAVAPEEIPGGMEDRVVERAVRGSRRTSFGVRGAVAAVAAAVVLVAGGLGGYLVRGGPAAPRVVELTSSRGHGELTLVYQPGAGSFLIGSNLPALSTDLVYELWAIRGTTPVPAGTFEASSPQLVMPVRADLGAADQVAVTIEHAPGAKHPTTKPIFSAPITQ